MLVYTYPNTNSRDNQIEKAGTVFQNKCIYFSHL